jgi:hypothetical protein
MSLVDKGIEEHFAGSHSVRTRCCCFVALRHTVIGVRPFHNREATTMKRDEINSATQLAGRIAAPLLALVILAAGCSSAHASTASTNRAGSSAASAPPTAEPGTPAKPVAAKGRVIQLDGQSLTIADIIDIATRRPESSSRWTGSTESTPPARSSTTTSPRSCLHTASPRCREPTSRRPCRRRRCCGSGGSTSSRRPPRLATAPCPSSTPAPCAPHGRCSPTATHAASPARAPSSQTP